MKRWGAIVLLLAGCTSDPGGPAAGSGAADLGVAVGDATPGQDSGFATDGAVSLDGNVADSGMAGPDASAPGDAGMAPVDAGMSADAGTMSPTDAGVMPTDAGSVPPDAGVMPDAGTSTVVTPRPIIFVHGIGGHSGEFAVLIDRLVADGWPRNWLRALDFEDPRWGCNVENADAIATAVSALLADTGQPRIDLVAHSMGTLSSRHFMKNLGGTQLVNTYVTLGGLHHGNRAACLNPLPVCVWQELCPTNPFLMSLNAPPATPGPSTWVSIFSTDDERVDVDVSMLMGAENIQVSGPTHAGPTGLLESPVVYPHILRVLRYPPW